MEYYSYVGREQNLKTSTFFMVSDKKRRPATISTIDIRSSSERPTKMKRARLQLYWYLTFGTLPRGPNISEIVVFVLPAKAHIHCAGQPVSVLFIDVYR